MKVGYLIGALKNPEIPIIANTLRAEGYDIVDDWYAAGPEADDIWRQYELGRNRSYRDAIKGIHAAYAFQQDKDWLQFSNFAVLVLPAGKSAHLELGWFAGQDKPCWVLFDKEPERLDLMYKFATGVVFSLEELTQELQRHYGR